MKKITLLNIRKYARTGIIKDRNGTDLREAEDKEEVARAHRKNIQKRS